MKPEVLDAIAHDIDEMPLPTFLGSVPKCPVRLGGRARLVMGHCPSFFKWADALRPAGEEADVL